MKAEARNKIKEVVLYLLDTNDTEVVNHYVDMIMEIVRGTAKEGSESETPPSEQ